MIVSEGKKKWKDHHSYRSDREWVGRRNDKIIIVIVEVASKGKKKW